MKITRLSLENVRAFKEADFTFKPGFNLIVGINGAGKSTALDAIRFCGSHLLSASRKMPFKPISFGVDDIHGSASFAEATLYLRSGDKTEPFLRLREWRELVATESVENVESLRREILETERPRIRLRDQLRELQETVSPAEPVYFYPSKSDLKTRASSEPSAPLMIHYSTARSIMNEQAERKSAAGTSQLAYVNAIQSNSLSLRQFADWIRAQMELASERPASRHIVDGIRAALESFLPGYSNLRPSTSSASRVEIDINGTTLDVRQLSDGERSILSLVLDIAKRLSQANPQLADPLSSGEAIVLIDEIDMHLHPQWQRKIVGNLEKTFPNCQFIATTHSPFIIQSLKPGELINLDPEEPAEYSDKSIEDITENVMGVDLPQKSERYREMMQAAEEYFTLVREPSPDQNLLAARESRLNEMSIPFSDDPAFQALLKLERTSKMGGNGNATS